MKNKKGYKMVAIIYLVVAVVNVIWICNYKSPSMEKETVKNENQVAVNY